jgi:hypothetical protein
MPEWQYRKIDLSDLPPKTEAIDLLNDAGSEGWEVITITGNGVAYLKLQIERPAPAKARASSRAKVAQS